MSRPFSYSDENFTVIDNILYLHTKITKNFKENENIIEIPPSIYDRMYYKSLQCMLAGTEDNLISYDWVNIGVKKSSSNGKFYFYTSANIGNNYVGYYLISWYVLKDI